MTSKPSRRPQYPRSLPRAIPMLHLTHQLQSSHRAPRQKGARPSSLPNSSFPHNSSSAQAPSYFDFPHPPLPPLRFVSSITFAKTNICCRKEERIKGQNPYWKPPSARRTRRPDTHVFPSRSPFPRAQRILPIPYSAMSRILSAALSYLNASSRSRSPSGMWKASKRRVGSS